MIPAKGGSSIPQKNIIATFYKSNQYHYISNDGMILSLTMMQHFETLKLQYLHKYNQKPPKNTLLSIIPNILNNKIVTTIMINDSVWSVYHIASKYILVCNGEWVADYKLSLILPKYKHFGFNQTNMTIYDSILNMNQGKLVKVGNKWCDLCINPCVSKTETYEIFGGIYCGDCFNQFVVWKNQLIYKYILLNYLTRINDISQMIVDLMIQIYNLFY